MWFLGSPVVFVVGIVKWSFNHTRVSAPVLKFFVFLLFNHLRFNVNPVDFDAEGSDFTSIYSTFNKNCCLRMQSHFYLHQYCLTPDRKLPWKPNQANKKGAKAGFLLNFSLSDLEIELQLNFYNKTLQRKILLGGNPHKNVWPWFEISSIFYYYFTPSHCWNKPSIKILDWSFQSVGKTHQISRESFFTFCTHSGCHKHTKAAKCPLNYSNTAGASGRFWSRKQFKY